MTWQAIIDQMKEWVIAQGYATVAWVQAQGYLTAGFVNRGDAPGEDFNMPFFTTDSAWHEIDLSAIVPAGAKGVTGRFSARASQVDNSYWLRPHGHALAFNSSAMQMQVANITKYSDFTLAISADRKIDYFMTAGPWVVIELIVKGWWF